MARKKISEQRVSRFADSGKYTVARVSKNSHGERWNVIDEKGNVKKSVLTASSSAAVLDGITTKHSKVLKKLAKD